MKTPHVLALALVSALAVACGGASSDAASDSQPTQSDEEALKTSGAKLTQDLLCAAVAAYNDNSEGSGMKGLDKSDLHGDALKDFKAWQKGMEGDYPSIAFELPVTFKGKTYKFIAVTEMNDGGGYGGIYKLNGDEVATSSGSESGPITWSSPADKCEQ